MTLRLGTPGSAVARAQAEAVAKRLGAELVVVDTARDAADADIAEALRAALRAGEVDAVVHAYARLPLLPADGLTIAAVPKRSDARDVVCGAGGHDLDTLPAAARVGADSPRRRAQLLRRRPDLEVVDLHGDVEARLARVGADDPEHRLDAAVLSAAGLERLGRPDAITEWLSLTSWPTTPAQGALAIETRTGDARSVSKLEHKPSRLTADAERGVLARLGAASAPLGASALLEDGLLFLSARVYALDGSEHVTSSHALYPEDSRDPAGELAARVADELLEAGAADLAPLGGRTS